MSERQREDRLGDDKPAATRTETIVEEAESHPIGTRVGAYGGALAGGLAGIAVAGPPGGVVGAAVGALAGGVAGMAAGHRLDPAVEDAFWRETYHSRPYVSADETYETYQPAYRYGWESRSKHADRNWEDVESELARNWSTTRGTSGLQWDRAKLAAKDAWHRVERTLPGDADRDGR